MYNALNQNLIIFRGQILSKIVKLVQLINHYTVCAKCTYLFSISLHRGWDKLIMSLRQKKLRVYSSRLKFISFLEW